MRSLLALVALCGTAAAQPIIGDAAPELGLVTLDGARVSTAELRGRVVAVDFFATWCEPCHDAMAALDALARAEPRLKLVIVDVNEDPATVRAFFAAHPAPARAQVLVDQHGAVARSWGMRKLPTTFFLDAGAVIRHINRGYGPGYPERVAGWVRGLLAR